MQGFLVVFFLFPVSLQQGRKRKFELKCVSGACLALAPTHPHAHTHTHIHTWPLCRLFKKLCVRLWWLCREVSRVGLLPGELLSRWQGVTRQSSVDGQWPKED